MYPEFIAIYVMLAIVIVMLGVIFFFLFKLFKRANNSSNSNNSYFPTQQTYYEQQYQAPTQGQYPYQQQSGNIVFCKNCATQFDSSQAYCPNCGARR